MRLGPGRIKGRDPVRPPSVRTMTTHAALPDAAGLSWRPVTPADVPALHALARAAEEVDQPAERYAVEDIEDEVFAGSWHDPERDTVAAFDADGTARAFGKVTVFPGDTRSVRAFCWGWVHPAARGGGLGRALLDWQVRAAREKVAAHPVPAPARAVVHVDEHVAVTRRLLERSGFTEARWHIEMTRTLDGELPAAPPDDGLTLVPFTSELSEAVRLAHNESFADHWGSEPRTREAWEQSMVGGRWFRPEWSFVVLDGAEVAGYTLASGYEPDWAAAGYRFGWTDLVGVRPAWRGRGVAATLLAASMAAFRAGGMERAELSVDSENAYGALGLYERLGYRASRRQITYVLPL